MAKKRTLAKGKNKAAKKSWRFFVDLWEICQQCSVQTAHCLMMMTMFRNPVLNFMALLEDSG